MAQIILSSDEIVCILTANGLVPDQVRDIEAGGEDFRIRVRTSLPILKSVRVGFRFVGFSDGHIILQLVTNRFIDAFDWVVDRIVESLRLEEQGGRWEYPRLYVDVNRLLQQQVRGVQVVDVVFKDDRFHITTVHTVEARPCETPEAE